jgi:Asp-tRNA(Asn)/Glu-tRNA(Gln) amidotransferase A subunit family amidase
MSGQKRCFLTATELAYGVRAKELLAVEVMEARLAQIARINPQVDAVPLHSRRRRSGGRR